jgi:tetratricopeptide (TPR) repeat protein
MKFSRLTSSCFLLLVFVTVQCSSAESTDPELVGTWETTAVLDGRQWTFTYEIKETGHYRFTSVTTDGKVRAQNGQWSVVSPTGFSDRGKYSFSGSDSVSISGKLGTAVWKRVQEGDKTSGSRVDPALIGTWKMQAPIDGKQWTFTWDILGAGNYMLSGVTEEGTYEAKNGQWKSVAASGTTEEGTYTFRNQDTVSITGPKGTGVWTRVADAGTSVSKKEKVATKKAKAPKKNRERAVMKRGSATREKNLFDNEKTNVEQDKIPINEKQQAPNVASINLKDALAQLKSSIQAGKTLPQLIDLAIPLVQARQAKNWNREKVYSQREMELKRLVSASPGNPDALVALAQFYLRPLATRQVADQKGKFKNVLLPLRDEWREFGGKSVYAVPWVFRGDPDPARPLLMRALKLNPNHHGGMRAYAMALRMKHDLDRMQPYVKRALAIQPIDLDMARLYLDYYTSGARVLNDQATQLRKPSVRYEDRADGRYKITTPASAADKAKAKELDRQAQDWRRHAPVALKRVAEATKRNPSQKITYDLANAVYYHWLGELERSGGAIKSALKEDPYNFDAIEMMIDLATGTHTGELRDKWQGWLASLMGTSVRVQLNPVFKLVKDTRYRRALQQLDEAERIDPGATLIPAYRTVVFERLNDPQGVMVASQLALALEGAKAKVAGRSLLPNAEGELSSWWAGLSIQMRFYAARALRGTDLTGAIGVSESALVLAERVPEKDWDTVVDTTDMPGTPKGGRSVRGLLIDHHRLLSELFATDGNQKQSSYHREVANNQQQMQQRIHRQQQREKFTNQKPLM